MQISISERSDVTVVAISGSVDGLTADNLLDTLNQQLSSGHARLVGDLSGVDYTSSAGLRALLATVKSARTRGGDLRLAAVNPAVRKVLELSGFTTIMKTYADVASAVASYGD